MAIKPIAPGVSLPLWSPDEEILAENINLRERRYGGGYVEDNIGMSTGVPIFTFSTAGQLYGTPAYGLMIYSAKAGAGLIEDSMSILDNPPSFVSAIDGALYGTELYGFFGYAVQNITQDSLNLNTQPPSFTQSITGVIYGSGTGNWGFENYGASNPPIDSMTLADGTISLLTAIVSANVYGQGYKYGFSVYQA